MTREEAKTRGIQKGQKHTEDPVEKAIKLEEKRLRALFADVSEKHYKIVTHVISQVAFMSVKLRELQDQINTEGCVEEFVQGSQRLFRETPAHRSYSAMIKNYNSSVKILLDVLPHDRKAIRNTIPSKPCIVDDIKVIKQTKEQQSG